MLLLLLLTSKPTDSSTVSACKASRRRRSLYATLITYIYSASVSSGSTVYSVVFAAAVVVAVVCLFLSFFLSVLCIQGDEQLGMKDYRPKRSEMVIRNWMLIEFRCDDSWSAVEQLSGIGSNRQRFERRKWWWRWKDVSWSLGAVRPVDLRAQPKKQMMKRMMEEARSYFLISKYHSYGRTSLPLPPSSSPCEWIPRSFFSIGKKKKKADSLYCCCCCCVHRLFRHLLEKGRGVVVSLLLRKERKESKKRRKRLLECEAC